MGKQPGVADSQGICQKDRVKKGSRVNLTLKNGRVIVEPVKRRKYTVEELVSKITPRNRHSEIDWGKPQGKEISPAVSSTLEE